MSFMIWFFIKQRLHSFPKRDIPDVIEIFDKYKESWETVLVLLLEFIAKPRTIFKSFNFMLIENPVLYMKCKIKNIQNKCVFLPDLTETSYIGELRGNKDYWRIKWSVRNTL